MKKMFVLSLDMVVLGGFEKSKINGSLILISFQIPKIGVSLV
jgi:hypothetical protein